MLSLTSPGASGGWRIDAPASSPSRRVPCHLPEIPNKGEPKLLTLVNCYEPTFSTSRCPPLSHFPFVCWCFLYCLPNKGCLLRHNHWLFGPNHLHLNFCLQVGLWEICLRPLVPGEALEADLEHWNLELDHLPPRGDDFQSPAQSHLLRSLLAEDGDSCRQKAGCAGLCNSSND